MTRLDGNNADAKSKLNSKLEVAFRRLRRMHRPSRNAFMICSEGLMNSLLAYCGHHLHIVGRSREVGGEVAPHFQQFERARSAPRVELYVQVDGQSRVSKLTCG
eukprot:2105543-Prymnesium_polylepis.1